MDLGPISAIRPVTMVTPSAAPDLSRVFEVEYLGESDDEYTPANRKPSRGLEDELEESSEMDGMQQEAGSVSIFA